ncbi:MAG: HAMP domain-containing histidine kinase [Spirochaetales bacterium]|nr:HAMP domain-containing histidine kinase [Spirochaetales bacterium]
MKFRIKLQLTVLPFIIIPLILASLIYTTIGREMLRVRTSEVLQLRLDSLYRYAEAEFLSLKTLGLSNTNFFNNKSWKSVEQFALQLQGPGDPLFVLKDEKNGTFNQDSGFKIGASNVFEDKEVIYYYYYKKLKDWDMIIISATEHKSIYKPIDNATRLFILISLISITISVVIVFIISNRITKPLEKLTGLAKNMANYNLTVRADIQSNDEIGTLSENFNIMVERLEESTRNLEEKVELRTKELNDYLIKLQQTQKQLVESEKMAALGSLVAGISHEINTPIGIGITAISFVDQTLKDIQNKVKNGVFTRSEFDSIISNCIESSEVALSSLVRGGKLVSSFKKVAVDQHVEEKIFFNMQDQMENVLTTLKPYLRKNNVSVTIIGDKTLNIDSYPGALWQISSNIILNAILHAFDGREEGDIVIEYKKNGSNIDLIFADNGKGMHESELFKIFDPFYTTKRDNGGTGLGLNIVYNIATQLLKGTIECKSVLGSGTTFILSFPT